MDTHMDYKKQDTKIMTAAVYAKYHEYVTSDAPRVLSLSLADETTVRIDVV